MHREHGVAQLVKWNAKKARTYVRAISVDLDRERRARTGRIFGLLSVAAPPKIGDSLAANIEDALERGIDEALRRLPAKATQEELFESAVARLNHALSLLLDEHGLPIDPGEVHAVVISQHEGHVAMATWGRPVLLLLRDQGQKVSVFDLGAQHGDQPSFDNTVRRRGFSSLIIGDITTRDRIIAATHDIRPLLTDDALDATMAAQDTEAITAAIGAMLSNVGDEQPIGVLAIDLPNAGPRPVAQKRQPRPKKTEPEHADAASSHEAIVEPRTTLAQMTAQGAGLVADTLGSAVKAAGKAGVALASGDGRKAAFSALAGAMRSVPQRAADGFNGLSLFKKLILVSLLAVMLSFNIGLAILGIERRREEKAAAYEEQVGAVTQKVDAAETSILYKDEDRARALLADAASLLAALPEKTEDQLARKTDIRGRIDATTVALKKAVDIGDAQTVASIPSGKVAAFTLAAGAFWALGDDGVVSKLAAGAAAEQVATLDVSASPASFLLFAGDGSLLAGTRSGGAISVKSGKTKALDLSWPAGEIDPSNVASWGSSLYVLDAAHNRIMKQNAAGSGYAAPQHYLKDATDVSSAVDFAIDGAVNVLLAGGRILKITKGSAEPFSVTQPDPAISAATALWTDEASSRLYVLEPEKSRVVMFDKKSGSVVAQMEAPALREATVIVVDEKNNAFYAARGADIMKFPLPAK